MRSVLDGHKSDSTLVPVSHLGLNTGTLGRRGRINMKDAKTRTKSETLSVGETAKRLDISPDSVRNYCERGWLQFIRGRGNHRRILLRSIESFEAQRNPKEPESAGAPQFTVQKRQIDDEFEIYYLGNEEHPNEMARGYVCNLSFFQALLPAGFNPSTILRDVGSTFGGGTFKVLRLRDGVVISERIFSVPGQTKIDVEMLREVYMDS
jgi:hypothetical protein